MMTQPLLEWAVPPGMTIRAYKRHVAAVRAQWETGVLPPGVAPQWLVDAWASAHDAQVPRVARPARCAGTALLLPRDQRRMELVLAASRAVFGNGAESMIAIADDRGLVQEVWGSPVVRRRSEEVGLAAGVQWDLAGGGLNAIGYVAAHGVGCVIFAETHTRPEQFDLVCTAFPIFFRGRVIAIANATDLWHNLRRSVQWSLGLFAATVTEDLARDGRCEKARMEVAAGWPERITGPAVLVDRVGVVVDAHETVLEPGDQITMVEDREAGPCWVPELGWSLWEPLYGADGWLVRRHSDEGQADLLVTLDFSNPAAACHVSVRGPVVRWEQSVTEPQHAEILRQLGRYRDGLTATELAEALLGDPGRAAQARVLLSRLRKQVGGLLATDQSRRTSQVRYRLARAVVLT